MELTVSILDKPDTLIEINNAAVPDVNGLDGQKAHWLVENAILAKVAAVDGQAAGVIVVLSENSGYDSDYFRWYTERYRNFIYIDRVIVSAWARGFGVATALYQEVEQFAQDKGVAIAAEVYSDPPNIASLNFHRKMGYQEVGIQFSAMEGKTVAKLMKYLEQAQRKKL